MVSVRGAEVYELADEEGNLLNDPATQKERVSRRLMLLGNGRKEGVGWLCLAGLVLLTDSEGGHGRVGI